MVEVDVLLESKHWRSLESRDTVRKALAASLINTLDLSHAAVQVLDLELSFVFLASS